MTDKNPFPSKLKLNSNGKELRGMIIHSSRNRKLLFILLNFSQDLREVIATNIKIKMRVYRLPITWKGRQLVKKANPLVRDWQEVQAVLASDNPDMAARMTGGGGIDMIDLA
jgi:hypothetical protein